MGGTKAGGRAAAKTNKRLYGRDYYRVIGKTGGENSREGGFYTNRELARTAGSVGGRHGKRGYKYLGERDGYNIWESHDGKSTIEERI